MCRSLCVSINKYWKPISSPQQILSSGFRSRAHLATKGSQKFTAGGASHGAVLNVRAFRFTQNSFLFILSVGGAIPVANTFTKERNLMHGKKPSTAKII